MNRGLHPAFLATLLLVFPACCPSQETDSFGIQKIYADAAPPANSWIFSGNPRDPRFMEQHVTAVSGGWFRRSDSRERKGRCPALPTGKGLFKQGVADATRFARVPQEMRLEILSDPTASEQSIETFDLARVLEKGYLFKPPDSLDGKGDFPNIEQTWRFKVLVMGPGNKNGGPHIESVPGGYRQTSSRQLAGRGRGAPLGLREGSVDEPGL